ncbi:MAG: DUF4397 domain-containing protein [Haloferacaceae archaeon]
MPSTRRQVLGGLGAVVTATVVPARTALADDDEETAGLRVAHASPDAPNVDVYVDGAVAVSGLEFRSVTDYLEVPTGEREVAVNVAGTDTTVFGPTEIELAAEDYTAVALGEASSDDSVFTVSLFEDTNGANLGDDEARVRAIHASPDAPAVDVTANDGALTVFDGFAFGESSGYAVVPADEYEIEVRPDTENNDGTVVKEVSGVTLAGGSTYTVFAVGYLTPDGEPADEAFGLVLVEDVSAPPRGDEADDEDEDPDDPDDEDEGEEDEDDEDEGEEDEDEDDRGRGRRDDGGDGRGRGRRDD